MKRAILRLDTGKGGWIHTSIAPVNDKHEARFGMVDVLMLASLVFGTVAFARVLLAN